MRNMMCAAGAALCLAATGAQAQDVFYWPASAPASAQSRMRAFPTGTPIAVTTRTDISTKDVRAGDRVYLKVAENLIYNGQIVLPIGAPVVGEITRCEKNGHFGKKGKLMVSLLYVQTPMGPVALDGEAAKAGRSGTALSVATIALVSPWGFLIHGTSATLTYGSSVNAYLAQPLKFMDGGSAVVSASEVQAVSPQAAAPQAVAYLQNPAL